MCVCGVSPQADGLKDGQVREVLRYSSSLQLSVDEKLSS